MFDDQSLSHLLLISKNRDQKMLAYFVHLTLDERIDFQRAHFFLLHQTKHVSIYLQNANHIHNIFSTEE